MVGFWAVFRTEHYRQLLMRLTARELAQRYKQSVLGYFWVILNPLCQMLVMSFVFSRIFANNDLGVPYPLFLFAALLPWNLFANSLSAATNALVGNSGLLAKIYFPREVLVLSTMLARIVDFLFALLILIGLMFFYHWPIGLCALWAIPIFFVQTLFTYGLGLFLAAANLFYRDIQYLLSLIIMTWMYLTPVMYNSEIFPASYRWIFQINPLAVFVNAYREVILNNRSPNFLSLGIALVLSVVTVVLGFKFFKKYEGQFADSV